MKPFSSYTREDLSLIKGPAFGTMVFMIACVIAYLGSLWFRDVQERALKEIGVTKHRIESLHRNVAEEERTIRNYLKRYNQLTEDGLMGNEDRLGFIETLAGVTEKNRLFPVHVEVDPQFSWAGVQGRKPGSGLALRASVVRISLSLLHEGDLLVLLDSLNFMPGLFVTESCVIERSNSGVASGVPDLGENLIASCRLFWVTLQE